MTTTKEEFIKTFLPESIVNIRFAQIDLDISDLSIADVLRNVHKTFPINTRDRNNMASGTMAVGILCKTELLEPMSGLLIIVTTEDVPIEVISKNYIVVSVPESRIAKDDDIKDIIDGITKYLIREFKDSFEEFNNFFTKFVYDEYELELLEEAQEEHEKYL